MKDVCQMLSVYNHHLSDKVKEFAEPLNQYFGIEEFVYTNISNDGRYFAISNQPEPSEFYFCNGLYKSNLLIRHPDNYSNGPYFPSCISQIKKESIIGKNFGYYGDTAFVMFKKTEKGLHKFLFNSKKHTISILTFYVQNYLLFESFCDRFLVEWASYSPFVEKFTINMAKLIGPDFYKITYPGSILDPFKDIQTKEMFLKKIGSLPKDFIPTKNFSKQEKACLNLLSQGKSLKETAIEMNLSYRTAEHYLENIKDKSGCLSKAEVMDQVHYLKLIGLI